MADITLAEFNGAVWLVGGEDLLHDMLANTLPKDISIEFVSCERASDVQALWTQNCGPRESDGMPWQINPKIVARIRRNRPEHSVYFAQWSAMLDSEAQATLHAAAVIALDAPGAPVELVEFIDPAAPASIASLSHLRAELIIERLVELGVPPDRIARTERGLAEIQSITPESQRVDIIIRPI
jgi:hypothetical protein